MGPNNASGIIWAISKFFLIKNHIQSILTIIFRYISFLNGSGKAGDENGPK